MPAAVIAALKQEVRAVAAAARRQGQQPLLVQGGVGPRSASATVQRLLCAENPPALICSTGFCGGLSAQLEVGDLIVADVLIAGGSPGAVRLQTDAGLCRRAAVALRTAGVRFQVGAIVCVHPALTTPQDKDRLGTQCKALAVDMESFAIASGAGAAAKVLVVRAVSDGVQDELPADVGGFLSESGQIRLGNVARYGLASPANFRRLWGLKTRSRRAFEALTRGWQALWPLLLEHS